MASLHRLLTIAFSCFLLFNVCQAGRLTRVGELLLPVRRDELTGLHSVILTKRTPALSLPYLIDLNSPVMWVNCEQEYTSTTYQALPCSSEICSRVGFSSCLRDTCGLNIVSPLSQQQAQCELAQDVLSLPLGPPLRQIATVQPFTFACAPSVLLQQGFPQEVRGVAGFGPSPVALPYQFASHFGYQSSFSLCLAASSQESGAVYFGSVPSGIQFVGETPLIISKQREYLIGLKSISISGRAVEFQSSYSGLLQEGVLKALLSTTQRYLALESSVYQAVTQTFVSQLQSVRQVQATAPFGLCFDQASLGGLQAIPSIDLVLHREDVVWTLAAQNILVVPQPGVACLAAVDGGLSLRAPIVLGTHQLENYLLQFDLQESLLRFSSPLALGGRTCSGLVA